MTDRATRGSASSPPVSFTWTGRSAEVLKGLALTRGLDPRQREAFQSACAVEQFAKGEGIVEQGAVYDSLKILFHGSAEVHYADPETGTSHEVATLAAGDHFGEMAFLSGEAATASVRASSAATVLVISRARAAEEGIHSALLENLASLQLRRLEASNKRQVAAMERTIASQREQNAFGRFYIATIVLFAIASAIPNYDHESPTVQLWMRWFFLVLILIPSVVAVKAHSLSLSSFGVTTRGWARSLREGLLVAAVAVPVMIVFRVLHGPADAPLFSWRTLDFYTRAQLIFYGLTYVPHSAIQEFIARGVGQGSLERFMVDAHPSRPVLVASSLFAILHLHLSLEAAVLTFVVSLLFGWLYQRHHTLVGVTALHVVLGLVATALGLI